jgi:hypothetical protein
MSRYRKIEVRTWSDDKFRHLSPIPPCGQGLWFFLLTGPHTGPIPGLFRAGRAGMAEELGWSLEAFAKAFREVFAKGMAKADFEARLIWLPNALKHNKPGSPNVVRSWATEWELLPECALKNEAYEVLCEQLKSFGDSYLEAFVKTCPKPSPKPFEKASPNPMANQEQEQDQEQEINIYSPSDDREAMQGNVYLSKRKRKLEGRQLENFEMFWNLFDYRSGKAEAADAWLDLKVDDVTLIAILAGAERECKRRKGLINAGLTPKMAQGWLNGRRWEDENDGQVPQPKAGNGLRQSNTQIFAQSVAGAFAPKEEADETDDGPDLCPFG